MEKTVAKDYLLESDIVRFNFLVIYKRQNFEKLASRKFVVLS